MTSHVKFGSSPWPGTSGQMGEVPGFCRLNTSTKVDDGYHVMFSLSVSLVCHSVRRITENVVDEF